jgi:O-Antigen ligase
VVVTDGSFMTWSRRGTLDVRVTAPATIRVIVSVGLAAAALGWSIASLSVGLQGPPLWGFLAAAGSAFVVFALVRPVYFVIGLLGISFVNPAFLPTLAEFGDVSVRVPDLLLILSCVAAGIRFLYEGKLTVSRDFSALAAPLSHFFFYVGVSLIWVWLYIPAVFSASFASYLRLLATSLIALITHWSLRSQRDVGRVQAALLMFALASVSIGIWEAWNGNDELTRVTSAEATAERYGGLLGVNSLGLVSGLLVIYGLVGRGSGRHRFAWAVPLAAGVIGLFLAKSISSTLATTGTAAAYLWGSGWSRSSSVSHSIKRLVIGALALPVAAAAIYALRTEDVTALLSFTGGSLAHRLMLAYAGLLIFMEHPLAGVGWQASANEAVMGSPSLNAILMQRFGLLPTQYFPVEQATSVHNMYIQILAELGLIGFLVFAYCCYRVGRVLGVLASGLAEGSPCEPLLRFHTLVLVFLLIWWNTTPLFGGQIETVLALFSVGVLSSLAQLSRREHDRSAQS